MHKGLLYYAALDGVKMVITTQVGDKLLRHSNGRFALISNGTVAPIAFKNGIPFAHSKRPADSEYLGLMTEIGWEEVPVNTDILFTESEIQWPIIIVPEPPPQDPPMDPPADPEEDSENP